MRETLSKRTKISMLAALSYLLMLFSFPLPFFPSFLKIDFSDVPAVLGALMISPSAGVAVMFFKNLIKVVLGTRTFGLGEVSNFLIGASYVYIFSAQQRPVWLRAILASICSSLLACVINYFVILPLYAVVMQLPIETFVEMGSLFNPFVHDLQSLILWSILPFNLIKCGLQSILILGILPLLPKELWKK